MSHYVSASGRPVVACDDLRDGRRCGNRSFGRRDRWDPRAPLSIGDLPRGWSVAPFPDDFDHGARTGAPNLVGVKGDLHTCPDCCRLGVGRR